MALDGFLVDLLQDPVDHGHLLYVADQNVLYNPRLRVVYEVRDSIPVLLADESRPATDEEDASFKSNPTTRMTGSHPKG